MNDFKDEEFRAEIFKILGFTCGVPFGSFILKLIFEGIKSFEFYEFLMASSCLYFGFLFVNKSYEIMVERSIRMRTTQLGEVK